MIRLALMFAVVVIEHVSGRRVLPELRIKDGCYQVSDDVSIFRVEGEAVIMSFTIFERVLKVRSLAPPTARYIITKHNGTEDVAYQGEGRVQQHNKQLWFLPAQASDSGEYRCTYRNDTYCVTGRMKLYVYESSSVDMKKLSIPIQAGVNERLRLNCPHLDHFNTTGRLIDWYKNSTFTAVQLDAKGSCRSDGGKLLIPAVELSHAGVYTCQVTVLINQHQYKVSRVIVLSVQDDDPEVTISDPDVTSHTPVIQPPVIVSPLNGTIFESSHGSGLELSCEVFTECHTTDSTVVAWLVDDQPLELSYLDGRALQGGRRVTKTSEGCQIELRLVVLAITEGDVKTELKCTAQNEGGRQEVVAHLQLEDATFTWLVVAAVALSCFLTVVSIFIYVIFFKPKRKNKTDYILARQSSTFSASEHTVSH